jgi:hypothetical protein
VPSPHGPIFVRVDQEKVIVETPVPGVVRLDEQLHEVSPGRHAFRRSLR